MIEPCHQAEAAAATALPAELPQWDLGDLYESPTARIRGLYTFDMQRAVGYSTLNSLDTAL